jgi:hypothetical protein
MLFKQISKGLIMTVVLMLSIGTIIVSAANTDGHTRQDEKVKNKGKVISNSSITYSLVKNNSTNELELNIFPDDKKIEKKDLLTLKGNMPVYFKEIKSKGYKEVPVTLTLSGSVGIKKFKQIVKENNVDVNRFYIKTVDKNGLSGVISGVPSGDELVPSKKLNNMLNHKNNPLSVEGVVAVDGIMPVDDKVFHNLNTHKEIFLVDISQTAIKDKVVKSEAFKEIKEKHPDFTLDVNTVNYSWYVDKFTK